MVARRKLKAAERRELIADAADLDARGRPVPDNLPNRATIVYLERIRALVAKERGVEVDEVSRYAIAKRLGVTPNRISNYYVNNSSMDNKLAVIVARLLDDEPLQVIAAVEAERSARDIDRTFWQRVAATAAGVLVAIGAGISAPSPTSAAPVETSVYYVKSSLSVPLASSPPSLPGHRR